MLNVMAIAVFQPRRYARQVVGRESIIVKDFRKRLGLFFENSKLSVKDKHLLGGFTDVENEYGR